MQLALLLHIAMKSLHDHKHDFQALMTRKFFVDSRYSKDDKSRVVLSIILDHKFCIDCLIVVKLMAPLVRYCVFLIVMRDLRWDMCIKMCIGLVWASRSCLIITRDYRSCIQIS